MQREVDFEFDAPGVEAGFVTYATNGHSPKVFVFNGRGLRQQKHVFEISAYDPADYDIDAIERFCRIAIAERLPRGFAPSPIYDVTTLNTAILPWAGALRPYAR